MPPKGYVNVSTTLKIKDAEILREKLAQLGFSSLHGLFGAILRGEMDIFTSKPTGRTGNDKPQNDLISAKMVDRAGYGTT